MNKLKYIKLENSNGTFTSPIPISADATNVDMTSGNSVQTEIGDIDYANKGSIATQLGSKLEVSNIIAGSNITLATSGNNITISSSGGGGGSINDGVPTNGVIGFDGLASEIPGGYEVTTDPFPGSGGSSDVNSFYDTVALMKADENLSVGKVVGTLGYYTINDGGASKYLIRAATNDDVDDGGSIIILNNGKVAELIIKNNNINVMQFGIQENIECSVKLNKLIQYAQNNNLVNINFKQNGNYILDNIVTITSNMVKINGNNATINITEDKQMTLFKITSENCIIENLNFDGSTTNQNQWDITVSANLTIHTVFNITSQKININNVNIYNIWGQGLNLYGYNNVIIRNCIFNKIGGGYYYTDATTGVNDYFGDAIYFGGHNNKAYIDINNLYCEGYVDNSTQKKSRGGLVFENLDRVNYPDTDYTYINIDNYSLINFNRALHYEYYNAEINLKLNNGVITQDDSICVPDNMCHLIIENSTINHTAYDYNGSRSFRGFDTIIRNSTINMDDNSQFSIAHACNSIIYEDCIFNNIKQTMFNNATLCKIYRSVLNINDNMTGYLNYGSRVEIYDSVIKKSNTSTDKTLGIDSGNRLYIYNTKIYNLILYVNPQDFKSCLYLANSPSVLNYIYHFYNKTYVYVNNELRYTPAINQVFPQNEEVNFDNVWTQEMFTTGVTSLPIIPSTLPANFKWKKNNKYLLILYGTNEANNRWDLNFTTCYYGLIKTNYLGTPSLAGTINTTTNNPSGQGRQLDFEYENNTISKHSGDSGLYVDRVMYWILPYNYKDYTDSLSV